MFQAPRTSTRRPARCWWRSTPDTSTTRSHRRPAVRRTPRWPSRDVSDRATATRLPLRNSSHATVTSPRASTDHLRVRWLGTAERRHAHARRERTPVARRAVEQGAFWIRVSTAPSATRDEGAAASIAIAGPSSGQPLSSHLSSLTRWGARTIGRYRARRSWRCRAGFRDTRGATRRRSHHRVRRRARSCSSSRRLCELALGGERAPTGRVEKPGQLRHRCAVVAFAFMCSACAVAPVPFAAIPR